MHTGWMAAPQRPERRNVAQKAGKEKSLRLRVYTQSRRSSGRNFRERHSTYDPWIAGDAQGTLSAFTK